MTATITPPAGVSARADPALRLEDYRQALRFYLGMLKRGLLDALLFVDNSSTDLTTLEAEAAAAGAADRCEFIGFSGLDYPRTYGYGFGEFKLLDHGMAHSRLLRERPEAIVVKVTGRYKVHNLAKLLRGLPARFDVACDVRNKRQPWADLRIMAWTPAGYDRVLRGIYNQLRDDLSRRPPEMTMSRHLLGWADRSAIVHRLPSEPFVHGVRGYDGKNWTGGRFWLKHYARATLRKLLFWYPI